MKETPILFKSEMIRAVLENRKTMTRRIIKPQPNHFHKFGDGPLIPQLDDKEIVCKYGGPGDLLWVRETWAVASEYDKYAPSKSPKRALETIVYKADGENTSITRWRPSIFMPRWASRVTLEIVSVRVERLQDISEADAQHEGWDMSNIDLMATYDPVTMNSAREWFRNLWDSINAKPQPVYSIDDLGFKEIAYYQSFPWEDIQENRTYRGKPWFVNGNPCVWAITFKKLTSL